MATPKTDVRELPDTFEFDIEEMTLGDIEDFEEMTGKTLEDLTEGTMTGKMMTALVYIFVRRDDPEFTIEDARNTKIKQVFTQDAAAADPNADAEGAA